MPKRKGKEDLVMNKIIQKGLATEGRLKPEIQAIFDQLGIQVLKVIGQNGEAFTKSGDQVLISGPQSTMDALLAIFPKGFITATHCQRVD
jgi:hypothetical protein